MLILVVAVIGILLAVAFDTQITQNIEMENQYRGRVLQEQVVRVAEAVEEYHREVGSYPATLDELQNRPGFEHIKSYRNSWQQYMVSGSITDGVWTFNRSVTFQYDPAKGVTAANYLADNNCGTGDAATATSWCGSKKSSWYRSESREKAALQITTQRVRMTRFNQKLATYYSKNNFFPKKDSFGADIAVNSITPLRTLAGYAGSAGGCIGQYVWQGVPIDCADMFDIWGQDVGYQFITEDHIILVSESPFINDLGARVIVGADFEIKPPI